MNRVKSALSAALGLVVAIAAFGFFASVGLALIGVMATVGAIGAIAIGISAFLGPKADPTPTPTATATAT